jgi:hypothetical protein
MGARPAEIRGRKRRGYSLLPSRRCSRSAAMNRGSDVSWTTIEKPITAGIECSYKRPVVVCFRLAERVRSEDRPSASPSCRALACIHRQVHIQHPPPSPKRKCRPRLLLPLRLADFELCAAPSGGNVCDERVERWQSQQCEQRRGDQSANHHNRQRPFELPSLRTREHER